jgi:hypothetical protein
LKIKAQIGSIYAKKQKPTHWMAGSFYSPSSQEGSLPKAYQKQTSFAFGFFAPRLFTKASFRHILETKKPITL